MKLSYLKSTVILEPLICKWHAWIHLVSPLTAGLHFKNRYLKMLKSFIDNPKLHQQANKNPKLMGGFFVDLGDEDYEQAKKLYDEMNTQLLPLTALADDIFESIKKLSQLSKGQSLDFFYSLLPESLKGAVELLYSLNNEPNIRFLEAILYHRFYDTSLQTFILSCPAKIDDRPFVSSTPRFKKAGDVQINIPFSSPLIDELVVSRETGLDLEEFMPKLNLSAEDLHSFTAFFTDQKPELPKDRDYTGEGVRIRYFGHACVLLQTKHANILIDPLLGNDNSHYNHRYSYFDLPDVIDCVLISHAHQDHIALETLLQLRHKIKKIIVPRNSGGFLEDPSMQETLRNIGFNQVSSLSEFDSIQIEGIKITGTPFLGEHGDLNIQSKLAYHIVAEEKTFLFAVDSNNLDPQLYASIRSMLGQVDTVFIGMECLGAPYSWAYGPLSVQPIQRDNDQSRRLSGSNAEKALKLVSALGAQKVYVYAMGLEPWLSHILAIAYTTTSLPLIESDKFIKQCLEKNIPCERLYLKYECIYTRLP